MAADKAVASRSVMGEVAVVGIGGPQKERP
jgi:hypothetical protein